MKLTIKKFAEIKNVELTTPSAIIGENGAGKSSTYNAYLWCLTGKNKYGEELAERVYSTNDPMAEKFASVEVEINGVKFAKECRPTFKRVKGVAESNLQTLCANTYYIDGIETKKQEYDAKVRELCNGKEFQLFSDINYFSQLNKEKQLQIINEIIGIEKEQYFAGMRDVKKMRADLKAINDDLKKFTILQEATNDNLATLEDCTDYSGQIEQLKKVMTNKRNAQPQLSDEEKIFNEKVFQSVAELKKILDANKAKKEKAKANFNDLMNERNDIVRDNIRIQNRRAEIEKELPIWQTIKANVQVSGEYKAVSQYEKTIADCETQLQKLALIVKNYDDMKAQAKCTICANCSDLFCSFKKIDLQPKEHYENLIAQTRETSQFTKKLSEDLKQSIYNEAVLKCQQLRNEYDTELIDTAEIDRQIESVKTQIQTLESNIAELGKQIESEQAKIIAPTRIEVNTAEEESRLAELELLQKKHDDTCAKREMLAQNKVTYTTKLTELTMAKVNLERNVMAYETAEQAYRTDCELKCREIFPDCFTVSLFKELVSGGYENVCEISYNGKVWKNTALEIWGNFELTKTLQKAYGVKLPIFIDDVANIVNDDLIPQGEDVILLCAVKDKPLKVIDL